MEINYWAVIVSAVVSIVIGSLWYGPLFGKAFMKAMGMNEWSEEKKAAMKKSMTMSYVLQAVASLVMFYVLARFMVGMDQMSVQGGLTTALWVWVGFVLPLNLGDAVWGGKWSLFRINSGNMLVTLVAVGAILGGWQ